MKWVQPSPSFEILLPDNVAHQADERVSSFWVDGRPLLLQLSSYLRTVGGQIPAKQRLQERIATSAGEWTIWECTPPLIDETEQAIAETVDTKGLLWVHAYVVWPCLAVYATISGPADEVRISQNWAITALKTLRVIAQ